MHNAATDDPAGIEARDVGAIKHDPALPRMKNSGNCLEHGRLAGTICTKQCGDAAVGGCVTVNRTIWIGYFDPNQ
jgi:hypothetical protein